MEKRKVLLVTPLLVLCLGPACGGGSGAIPVEQLCTEMQKVYCSLFSRCELETVFELETHTKCNDSNFICGEDFDSVIESVQSGRTAYDGKLARDCLNFLKALDCHNVFYGLEDVPEECENIFTGMVPANGQCYADEECVEGYYCNESEEDCPGSCVPWAGIGESCLTADCDWKVAECQADVCVELAAEGEPCAQVSCQYNLFCDDSQTPSRCAAPGKAGAACTSTDQCASGLRCIEEKCTGPAASGQVCVLESMLDIITSCQTGLYCDADVIHQQSQGTCQPKKNQGEECVLFLECKPDLLCIGLVINEGTGQVTKGHCLPPIAPGGSCSAQMAEYELPECRYDSWCNPESSKCELLPGEGGTCGRDVPPDCNSQDLYCKVDSGDYGTCQKKKANGSNCEEYYECLSDNCSQGICKPDDTCQP